MKNILLLFVLTVLPELNLCDQFRAPWPFQYTQSNSVGLAQKPECTNSYSHTKYEIQRRHGHQGNLRRQKLYRHGIEKETQSIAGCSHIGQSIALSDAAGNCFS